MALPITRDLGHSSMFTPRMAAGQGRVSAEAFAKPIHAPHQASAPKPKVEKLPKVAAYGGLMMKGR